jgi:hypothetical protein
LTVFDESLVLPTKPARAFALLGDPANGPTIDPMIKRYEPEGGSMREGGRNHALIRAFGIPIRAVSVTRQWQPPGRMVLESIKPARPVRMKLTQTFEPHAEGTLLTYHAEIYGFRPAAAAFRWLLARNFQRAKPRILQLVRESADSG